MSEYMERHSVSKLIGAPGYVGYDQGFNDAIDKNLFLLFFLMRSKKLILIFLIPFMGYGLWKTDRPPREKY